MTDIPPWLSWVVTALLLPLAAWIGSQWDTWRKHRAITESDRREHTQQADDEIRRAYMASASARDNAVVQALERMVVIQETQMRTLLAMELREQERDRTISAIREDQRRFTVMLETFAPQLFGSRADRPYERREADRYE